MSVHVIKWPLVYSTVGLVDHTQQTLYVILINETRGLTTKKGFIFIFTARMLENVNWGHNKKQNKKTTQNASLEMNGC